MRGSGTRRTQPRHSARRCARTPADLPSKPAGPSRQATTRPRSTTRVGRRAARRGPRAGLRSKTTKSAVAPSARLASQPEPRRGPARTRRRARPRRSGRRRASSSTSLGDQAVRQHPAGVGAGVDRRRPPRTPPRSSRAGARAGRSMWSAYAGNFSRAGVGVLREVVELHRRSAPARRRRATIASIRSVGQPGAVLDAVDAGARSGRAAPSSPKQCAVTRAPCSCAAGDRRGERLARATTGPGRRRRARSSRRRA